MAATMMTMLMVSQNGPSNEPRKRILISCIAISDHIQLLDMPSTKSSHAASVRETGLGKSMFTRGSRGSPCRPTMMAFTEGLQVPTQGSRLVPVAVGASWTWYWQEVDAQFSMDSRLVKLAGRWKCGNLPQKPHHLTRSGTSTTPSHACPRATLTTYGEARDMVNRYPIPRMRTRCARLC